MAQWIRMLTDSSQADEISDKDEQSDRNCSTGHSCSTVATNLEASCPFQRFLWEAELKVDRLVYLLEETAKYIAACGFYCLLLVGLTESGQRQFRENGIKTCGLLRK